jgi:hypothetical protein
MKEQTEKVIKKTVWDWKGQPSVMAKDTTLSRSQAATKSRRIGTQFPANMQIFKEKK